MQKNIVLIVVRLQKNELLVLYQREIEKASDFHKN